MAVSVKVCGLTRARDAELAVRLGARYLGAIFAESPRRVAPAAARELAAAAGGVPLLGVFVDATPDEILRLRDRARLAGAQLHGAYDEAAAHRLLAEGMRVWAVARLREAGEAEHLGDRLGPAEMLLVEPRVEGAHGGTGIALPPDLATAARAAIPAGRFALAGGLTPETVGAAVALVRPDVVDVSSGVEAAPGEKDPERLRRFLEVVGDADARA